MSEEDIRVIIERLDNLIKNFNKSEENSEKWREHFDTKLAALPCSLGHDRIVDDSLSALWWWIRSAVVGLISLGLILWALAESWGSIKTQVDVNTKRWERYFVQHPDTK